MPLSHRLHSLEIVIRRNALDALLVTNLSNVRYLCGFSGSSGALAYARGRWAFFTDGRYTEQAKHQVQNALVHIFSGAPAVGAARWSAERLAKRKLIRIGIEADHVTLAGERRIASELRSVFGRSAYRVIGTSGIIEDLRIRKDPTEVNLIRRAVQLASSIFSGLVKTINPSISENDVAATLEYMTRCAGAEKMSFDSIVASGANSALPHARPTRRKIGRGFVVLDYGVILAGYCSDMTRTVWVGRESRQARAIYSAVLDAQLAAIAAVRPGVEAQAVDAVARGVLRKHQLDKYFTHSLGHGVGLEIHEAPRLAKGQTQKLEPGMVVTIEPGVYIPGKGGVRIEDMVLVTNTGCEVLTPTPKELLVI
jgi:Xaa-Pro aminopeptidase